MIQQASANDLLKRYNHVGSHNNSVNTALWAGCVPSMTFDCGMHLVRTAWRGALHEGQFAYKCVDL